MQLINEIKSIKRLKNLKEEFATLDKDNKKRENDIKALMNRIQPRKEMEKRRAVSRVKGKYLTTTNLFSEGLGNNELKGRSGNGFRTPNIINVENLNIQNASFHSTLNQSNLIKDQDTNRDLEHLTRSSDKVRTKIVNN